MAKYGVKRYIHSVFNVSKWIGFGTISQHAQLIREMMVMLFRVSQPPEVSEKYEDAVLRLGLSGQELTERQNQLLVLSRLYGLVLLIGLLYWVYLFTYSYWLALIMMSSFNLMIASFFFRESFWYQQLKQKRLGITFREWLRCAFVLD